jgi:Cu2+-containing amine oxidase
MRRLESLLILLALACSSAYSPPGGVTPTPRASPQTVDRREIGGTEIEAPPLPLTDAEVERARGIVNEALRTRNLLDERTFLVHAEMVHDKAAPSSRRALLQYYRYNGDLTITSIVDLGAQNIVAFRSVEHVPTGISREEFEEARALALADPRVVAVLGNNREQIVIEPLPLGTDLPEDRFRGHRVIRLLFRIGRDYLAEPEVFVDLTERRVIIEQPSPQMHHP